MKRRSVTPFSLSFLDIMFCGFGAVVLLVLILNTDTVTARQAVFSDLRGKALVMEGQVLSGEESLSRQRERLAALDRQLAESREASAETSAVIEQLEAEISTLSADSRARRAHIASLSKDLKQLDERKQTNAGGSRILAIQGEGDRQYLTGLKVGGTRVLILLDASASMLDETIVDVIRRRNGSADERRAAPKWRRSLATVTWLMSQLPPTSGFQVFSFDTGSAPVLPGSARRWLSAEQTADIDGVLSGLNRLAPASGTSLYAAMKAAAALSPRPDNILLITDGLPTRGRDKPAGTTVSADQRLRHFEQAVKALPAGIPVNILLMPMEGDAWAAAAYWKLALDTGGAFLTPARDWP